MRFVEEFGDGASVCMLDVDRRKPGVTATNIGELSTGICLLVMPSALGKVGWWSKIGDWTTEVIGHQISREWVDMKQIRDTLTSESKIGPVSSDIYYIGSTYNFWEAINMTYALGLPPRQPTASQISKSLK